MLDIRRILIILVVGVLFAVFTFSLINAVFPEPDYEDYCSDFVKPRPLREVESVTCPDFDYDDPALKDCNKKGGDPKYEYDSNGCIESWKCDYCRKGYDDAREKYNFWNFIIAAIFGLIGVAIALYMPMKKGTVHEWVGSGFMLGGLLTIFVGTAIYFGDLHRWARPIIILLELILVIWLAYKKLAPDAKKKKK